MRLLIVTGNLRVGGAEVVALELILALRLRGWEFVIAPVRQRGQMAEAFAGAGAEVCEGFAHRSIDALAPLRLARIIRRHDIDCLMVLDPLRNGMFYSVIAATLSGRRLPRVCWCHSWPGSQAGNFTPALRAYRRLGLLDAVVCVSPSQRRRLIEGGLPRRAVVLIRNGLDLARYAGASASSLDIPPGRKIVLQVANVMPDKDFDTLLKAAAKLASRRDDFQLVLVGNGTDSPAMRRAVEGADLVGRVTLCGHRDDVPGLLAAADVFVLSSRSETFGLSPLEAMASGVPVVTSDLPAFNDLFISGREGLKVAPADPAAMADAIERLLDDKALASRLTESASRRAESFGVDAMAKRFDRLLGVLCHRR